MATRATSKRDADATAPVRTIFLARDAASTVHRHDEHAAWIHVISGAIVEDRWTASDEHDGAYVHERRVLRSGQSMAAPGAALHRISALEDSAFVSTCACNCARAKSAAPIELERTLVAHPADDLARATAIGEPAPSV